jgi:hypothetical protein
VKDRKRIPSPGAIIGCIALFVALGGTGYAATRIAATRSDRSQAQAHPKAKHKKPSQKALIKAAVASYLAAHKADFRGPAGQAGKQGPVGLQGSKGDTGPAGLASETDTLAGPVETGSSSMVKLGGGHPTVTVHVGPSGLVAYWASAELKSVGGGTAEITLEDPTSYAPQLTTSSSSFFKLHTEPGSDSGAFIFNTGLSTEYVGPGTKTFSLEFSDTAGTGVFQEVELVVIPL